MAQVPPTQGTWASWGSRPQDVFLEQIRVRGKEGRHLNSGQNGHHGTITTSRSSSAEVLFPLAARRSKCLKMSESVTCSVMSNSFQPHGLSPPGSSVHGILQAKTLERVAVPFSRASS